MFMKFLLFLCFTIISTRSQRLVTKLIRYDSVLAQSDLTDRVLKHSNSRFDYLRTKSSTEVEVNIVPDVSTPWFVVNFSIGKPPMPQLGVMDTGSSLTWIQCEPCDDCFPPQTLPLFDPSKSSTFAYLPCNHSSCDFSSFSQYVELSCNVSRNSCLYGTRYEDGSTSTGRLAIDRFTFETSDGGLIVTDEVVFGCGSRNVEPRHGQWNGVFALGDTLGSIVNKLGRRFSYCVGSVMDPLYDFNRLVIGHDLSIEGYSTRLEKDDNFYYVTLEGISVGEDRLDLNPDAFKNYNGGGVIVDSGTVLTYLPANEYNVVKEKVASMLEAFLTQVVYEMEPQRLCYDGMMGRELRGFPAATFHLAEGVDLVLDTESLFYQTESSVFCMSILPFEVTGNPNEASIIGIMAQQNYNVVYDLIGERIYFQRIDCELLDD